MNNNFLTKMKKFAIKNNKKHKSNSFHVCLISRKKDILLITSNTAIHAEMHALKKVKNIKNKKIDIYVVKFSKHELIMGNSKPCQNCCNVIKKNKNIKNIYFSTGSGRINKVKRCKLENSHISKGHKKFPIRKIIY